MYFEIIIRVHVFSHVDILRRHGSLSSAYSYVLRRDWAGQKSVKLQSL